MRVVGGSAKGKKLLMVPGHGTRPIMDRVKTSLFDMLRPRIEGMHVLDLFAGSGSVGIEALSQGAAHCTFIDAGKKAVATIKQNLAATGLSSRAQVRHTDAFAYLKGTDEAFDLIYVAPPQHQHLWEQAVHLIAARPSLVRSAIGDPGEEAFPGLVIAQIDPREYVALEVPGLSETRQRRYGNTLIVVFEPA